MTYYCQECGWSAERINPGPGIPTTCPVCDAPLDATDDTPEEDEDDGWWQDDPDAVPF